MKRLLLSLVALVALVAGCYGTPTPTPTPVPPPPTPAVPTTVGATRFAQGPGLVVEGYTPLKQVHVELRGPGDQVLQKADVTPKDDGWYRVTWPTPDGPAEVIVSDPDRKILVRGALPGEINKGFFYGPDAQAVWTQFVDPKEMTTLFIVGRVRSADGKVQIQLRDGERILSTRQADLDRAAPDFASLNGKWPMEKGARTVEIRSSDGKQLIVSMPIVAN